MKRVIAGLVLIFLLSSGGSIVYAQDKLDDMVYLEDIRDFYLADSKLVSDEGATLVPQGGFRGENDVYYIEFEYDLVVKQGAQLQVSVKDLMFSNIAVSEDELFDTFNFDFSIRSTGPVDFKDHVFAQGVEAESVVVTVRVSMDFPPSPQLMKEMLGGQLTFQVYFFVV